MDRTGRMTRKNNRGWSFLWPVVLMLCALLLIGMPHKVQAAEVSLDDLTAGAAVTETGKFVGADYTIWDNGVCAITGKVQGYRDDITGNPFPGVTTVYADFTPDTQAWCLFAECTSVKKFIFTEKTAKGFANTTSFFGMFTDCTSLESIDCSNWDTSKVSDFRGMFYGCSSLKSVNASGLNTSSATDLGLMFYGCQSLTAVDLANWKVQNVTNLSGMFYNCKVLADVDLSGWNMLSANNVSDMFYGCYGLVNMKTPKYSPVEIALYNTFSVMKNGAETGEVLIAIPAGASSSYTLKVKNHEHSYEKILRVQLRGATSGADTVYEYEICSVCKREINSRVISDYTGIVQANNETGYWYYCSNGQVTYSYTGLVHVGEQWLYIEKGRVNYDATTLCKYNGSWWYVHDGHVDFSFTGTVRYNGSN